MGRLPNTLFKIFFYGSWSFGVVLYEIFTIGRSSLSNYFSQKGNGSRLIVYQSKRFSCRTTTLAVDVFLHTWSKFLTSANSWAATRKAQVTLSQFLVLQATAWKKVFSNHPWIYWLWKVVASLWATWVIPLFRCNEDMKFMSFSCGLKQFRCKWSLLLWAYLSSSERKAWIWKILKIQAFLLLLLK